MATINVSLPNTVQVFDYERVGDDLHFPTSIGPIFVVKGACPTGYEVGTIAALPGPSRTQVSISLIPAGGVDEGFCSCGCDMNTCGGCPNGECCRA